MKEETAEFVRKLRRVIKAVVWLWAIGSFVLFWIMEKVASQMRMPSMGTLSHPITPSAEAIKAATRMDWPDLLIGWAIYGIAPALVLGLVLYLMPGGKKKLATPGDSSGGV